MFSLMVLVVGTLPIIGTSDLPEAVAPENLALKAAALCGDGALEISVKGSGVGVLDNYGVVTGFKVSPFVVSQFAATTLESGLLDLPDVVRGTLYLPEENGGLSRFHVEVTHACDFHIEIRLDDVHKSVLFTDRSRAPAEVMKSFEELVALAGES